MGSRPEKFRLDDVRDVLGKTVRPLQAFINNTVDTLRRVPEIEFKTLELTDTTSIGRTISLGYRPRAVFITSANRVDGTDTSTATQLAWSPTDAGFEITDLRGFSAGETYTVTLLVVK